MMWSSTQIIPAVKFPCIVSGKHLYAELIADVANPVQYVYSIRFSDGYAEDFFCHELIGWCSEKGKHSPYLRAIKDDLDALLSFEIDKSFFILRAIIDQRLTNVWIFEKNSDGEGKIYKVYYKGDYRFEVKKYKGKWLARTKRVIDPEIIDSALAKAVTDEIDSHF